MKSINVKLVVKPARDAAYRRCIAALDQGSRAEQGNLSYDHYQSLTTPNEYEIIEHWRDAEAVESHNGTAHFQKFLAGINEFLTEPLEILRMNDHA